MEHVGKKVSLPPQCEGELMQATPCGLVTSSGKRETCGLYCLDHNPLCMEGSSTCVQGVHRRKMQTHQMPPYLSVTQQCRPEEDSWQLNIEHLQQRVSSRQL